MDYQYLTDEDFEIARQNGISRGIAYQRFYVQGWEKERAITKPQTRRNDELTKWRILACQNGISDSCFINRMKRKGMTPEQAATFPLWTKTEIAERTKEVRLAKAKVTPELVKRAEANGISKYCLFGRVYRLKWDTERACTEPPVPPKIRKFHKLNKS